LIIPVLIACSFIEQSIGYRNAAATAAKETELAYDGSTKSQIKKDCKDNGNDNSDAC
jgi:hypothetical protein